MENIGLAAVDQNPKRTSSPRDEKLPHNPEELNPDLTKGAGYNDEQEGPSTDDQPKEATPGQTISGMVLELFMIVTLMMLPSLLIWVFFEYETYSFTMIKAPNGNDPLREFDRWTQFSAIVYSVIIFSEILTRKLPTIIFWFCGLLRLKLRRQQRMAINCLRFSSHYLSLALSFFIIFNVAHAMIFTETHEFTANLVFSNLSKRQRSIAHELFMGEKIETLLAASFVFAILLAVEKYLMASIHASFHRLALAPRIAACNAKFEIISRLYRANSTLPLDSLETDGDADIEEAKQLSRDKGIDLSSVTRARTVAKNIFRHLCPRDRNYIISSDFRPFFAIGEHEKAFRIFDSNRRGDLDLNDFRNSILGIYDERNRTAKALIANSKIVKRLDWVLSILFALFGLILSLVILNSRGYAWVVSMGTFILGFSFLFQPTMGRIFDSFLFVFVEHAYDVSDNIIVDGEKLEVEEIQIFTTIFERDDGVVVYSPNSSLKGKTIYNKQRMHSEQDIILFTIDPTQGIEKLASLRSKLVNYLTESCNEFTGTVNVNVVRITDGGSSGDIGRATVRTEIKFRPKEDDLKSEVALHKRRASTLDKFKDLCKDLEIDVRIEDADE